jgi:5-methylcytosine-specific restriction endonuclease McrA
MNSDGFTRYSRHVLRTPRWRALRVQVLRRDRHRCTECGARGRLEIHHVRSVRTAPELAYDMGNLKVLCGACHARVTRYEVRGAEENPARAAWRSAVRRLEKDGNRATKGHP